MKIILPLLIAILAGCATPPPTLVNAPLITVSPAPPAPRMCQIIAGDVVYIAPCVAGVSI